MNKKIFFVALLFCSGYSLALNLSSTFNKETKMSITTLKEYQTYRLSQLDQLKAQGMDDKTYTHEVKKVKNLSPLPPKNTLEQLTPDIEDIRSFERRSEKILLKTP